MAKETTKKAAKKVAPVIKEESKEDVKVVKACKDKPLCQLGEVAEEVIAKHYVGNEELGYKVMTNQLRKLLN